MAEDFNEPDPADSPSFLFHLGDVIYDAAQNKKYLITINGTDHFGYTDSICLLPSLEDISQVNQQRIAKAYLTAFFRRYLKGKN